jgi:hypothetical protein
LKGTKTVKKATTLTTKQLNRLLDLAVDKRALEQNFDRVEGPGTWAKYSADAASPKPNARRLRKVREAEAEARSAVLKAILADD